MDEFACDMSFQLRIREATIIRLKLDRMLTTFDE